MTNGLNFPATWEQLHLGEVINYGDVDRVEPQEIPLDAWVLELEDIEKDTSKVLQRFTAADRRPKSAKNRFIKGDILYGKLRPYLNKVILADSDGYCSTEIVPLRTNSGINSRYLFYWLKHSCFLEYAISSSHGTNMPRLGTEAGRQAPFILAPSNEQERIADKLDMLFAQIDLCAAHIKKAAELVVYFHKVVLDAAIAGRLTREWRNTNGYDEWKFERAEDVCEKVQSGGTPREGFIEQPGIPFLKVYNIVNQKVDFDSRPQFVLDSIHKGSLAKSQVFPGDVLMNIVGPPLGKVAIVPETYREWNINQAITLFRPSSRITTNWLYYCLCSGKNIDDIINETRGTAGQVNISLSQCRNFMFSVPSVEEQNEVKRLVENLFYHADAFEKLYNSAEESLNNLRSKIIEKAFAGKLVAQESNDEAASVLISRIRTSIIESQNRAKGTRRRAVVDKVTKDTLKEAIQELQDDVFTFRDLQRKIFADHDDLRDKLFELLDDEASGVSQIFDKETQEMCLVRRKK